MKTAILSFFFLIASVGLFAQSKEELCIYIQKEMDSCNHMLAIPKVHELREWLAYYQGKLCAFREILNEIEREID